MAARNQRSGLRESIRAVKVEPGRYLSEVEVPPHVYQAAKEFASLAPNSPAEENCRFKMDFIYDVLKHSIKSGKLSGAREEVEGWQVASKALLRYALNLLLAPKRTEFRRIRLSNSYYVYQVSHKLKAALQILVYMGYGATETSPGQEPQELNYSKHDIDMERVLDSATDLVVLHGELELMKEFVVWVQSQNSTATLQGIVDLRKKTRMTYGELKAVLVHPEGQRQDQLLHRDVPQQVATPSGYAPSNQHPSSSSYQQYPDSSAPYRHPENSPEARHFETVMSDVRQYPSTQSPHPQVPGTPSQYGYGDHSQYRHSANSPEAHCYQQVLTEVRHHPQLHHSSPPQLHRLPASHEAAPGRQYDPISRLPAPHGSAPGRQYDPSSRHHIPHGVTPVMSNVRQYPSTQFPLPQVPGTPSQYGSGGHSQYRHPANSPEARCYQQVLTEVRHHPQLHHNSPPQPHRPPHGAAPARQHDPSSHLHTPHGAAPGRQHDPSSHLPAPHGVAPGRQHDPSSRLPAPHGVAPGHQHDPNSPHPVSACQNQCLGLQQDGRRSSSPAVTPYGHPAPTFNKTSAPPSLESRYFADSFGAKQSDSSSAHAQLQGRPVEHRLQRNPDCLHERLHDRQRIQGGGAEEPHFSGQRPSVLPTPSDRGSSTAVSHGGSAVTPPTPPSTGTDIAATQPRDSDSDSEPSYVNMSVFMKAGEGSPSSSQFQPNMEKGHKALSPNSSFDRNVRDLYQQYPHLAPPGKGGGGGGGGGEYANYTPGSQGRSSHGLSLSSNVDEAQLPGPMVATEDELAVLGENSPYVDVDMSFVSGIKNVRSVSTSSSLSFSFNHESTPRPLTPKARQEILDKWKVHDSIEEEAVGSASPSPSGTTSQPRPQEPHSSSKGEPDPPKDEPDPRPQSPGLDSSSLPPVPRKRSNAVLRNRGEAPVRPPAGLPLKTNPVAQRHKNLVSPTVDRSKVTASSPSPSPQHGAAKASLSEHREDRRPQDMAGLSPRESATAFENIELLSKNGSPRQAAGVAQEQTSLCSDPDAPKQHIAFDYDVSDTWECSYCYNLVPRLYVFCDICGSDREKDTQGIV